MERLGNILALLALFATVVRGFSQSVKYYEDIQPILFKNCISCHRPGQVAPFSLLTFEDAAQRAEMLKMVTSARYMPPWMADPAFQKHQNQRSLSPVDIEKIAQWADGGAKKGNKKAALDWQSFIKNGSATPDPDLVIEMDSAFQLPGDGREHFRMFVLPTRFSTDKFVRGIEYVPGNRRLTHHVRMMLDTTHLFRAQHGLEVAEVPEFQQINTPMADQFWGAWVPGNSPVFYTEGTAKLLPKDADIVLNVHYSPSPTPALDRPTIRIWLADKPPAARVQTFPMGEDRISNLPFVIEAGEMPVFYMRSPVLPYDIRLISVLPHMHLLGKSFKAWAITPGGDLVPLVKIDNWNFKWQESYQFDNQLVLPAGSVIYAEAGYDNTAENFANPHHPPRTVQYGWGTFDEMFNLILEFVAK